MKTIDRLYKDHKPLYPIENICDSSKALFVDIETTGLKKETTSLYMIGCGFYTGDGFFTKLFFAEETGEEENVLREFASFLTGFTHLLHFNGTKFDIPYLLYKAEKYGINDLFENVEQVDVYRLCKPLRYLLFPETMRQKAIEDFMGIKRDDTFDGGQLIPVYKEYEKTKDERLLELLVTHNREDVLGMHLILPVLYYLDLKDAPLSFEGYELNTYSDLDGCDHEEVIFGFSTDRPFPKSFVAKTDTMYLKASSETGKISIRLPLYDTEMKLFFDNYRDYCYLPDEDTVIPKALASSLPKNRYRKAVKENCCRKVKGKFMKQPVPVFTPVFRTEYKDRRRYFRFPEDFDKKAAEQFGRELINIFFKIRK